MACGRVGLEVGYSRFLKILHSARGRTVHGFPEEKNQDIHGKRYLNSSRRKVAVLSDNGLESWHNPLRPNFPCCCYRRRILPNKGSCYKHSQTHPCCGHDHESAPYAVLYVAASQATQLGEPLQCDGPQYHPGILDCQRIPHREAWALEVRGPLNKSQDTSNNVRPAAVHADGEGHRELHIQASGAVEPLTVLGLHILDMETDVVG